jgi:hypothetical protein
LVKESLSLHAVENMWMKLSCHHPCTVTLVS